MSNAATLAQPTISETSLTAAQIDTYDQEGYVLLPGLLSSEYAEALRIEVMGIMDKIGLGNSKLRQSSRYLAGGPLDALINSPVLLHIAEELMGGPGSLYLPFTAVKSGGGGGRFHFHQDNQYTRFDGPGINMWFALTEMTPENGCLQVVPASHKVGTLPSDAVGDGHRMVQHEPEEFVSILMQPGDCIAFTRLTVHGSGPNVTPDPRVAYAVQFHRNDVHYTTAEDPNPKSLKEHARFSVGPVESIVETKGAKEDLDGH